MTIVARDQASRVVGQVQKRVLDFGKDIGRSIAAVAGPMAIATIAFQKISAHFEEMAKKRKEAFDFGASLEQSAAVLAVTVQQMQALEAASQETGENVAKLGEAFKSAGALIASAAAGNEGSKRSIVALGFSLENLDKLKPQDILRALAGAMATVEDPAKKGEIAIAALGKEASKLQAVLEKGFDIAGAFEQMDDLSTEEARNFRELQKEERSKAVREKLKNAREESARRALDSQDMEITQAATSAGGYFSKGTLAADPKVQEAIREIQKRRQKEADEAKAKKDAEANKTAGGATPEVAGSNLIQKAEDDAKREAIEIAAKEAKEASDKERAANVDRLAKRQEAKNKKAAEDFAKQAEKDLLGPKKDGKDKAAKPLEVSSLRAIGGGIAGESLVSTADIAKEQLDTQKQMLDRLDGILKMQVPPTNSFIEAYTNISVV